MKISGKHIWITGASSGLGEELANRLAKDNSLLLFARNGDKLSEIVGKLSGNNHAFESFDVSGDKVTEATEELLKKYPYPDIVFFNAGISQRSIARESDPAVYRRLMDVNYFGVINPFLVLLQSKPESAKLHAVVTNSVAGKFGFWMRSGYAASKHALTGFFDTVSIEEYQRGLRVTQIFPGRINTPINQNALMADGSPSKGRYKGFDDAMTTEYVVGKIIKAVERKKAPVVLARLEWIPFIFYRISKSFFYSFFSKRKAE